MKTIAVAASLALAGCASVPGEIPPNPETQNQTATPSAEVVASTRNQTEPAIRPKSQALTSPQKQAMRLRMAMIVEGNIAYRGILDDGAPKLGETGIAGPVEYAPLIVGEKQRFYCVRAKLWSPTWPILAYRTSSFIVKLLPDGTESLQTIRTHLRGPIPAECSGSFEPFPELEQLRDKRRRALGKPD